MLPIHTFLSFERTKKEYGFATLFVTVAITLIITLATLYGGHLLSTQQRISASNYRATQAFEVAKAGLEYGVANLRQNPSIRDGTFPTTPVSRTVCAVTGSPCATYQYFYSLPDAGNTDLIQINVTGFSTDQLATHKMTQQAGFVPIIGHVPPWPLITKGQVALSGNMFIRNLNANQTIRTGLGISISGNATTEINDGNGQPITASSNAGLSTDVTTDDTGLAGLSDDAFFQAFFNVPATTIYNAANVVYPDDASVDSAINDSNSPLSQGGATVWVGPAPSSTPSTTNITITSNSTIGTSIKPVVLIVNGILDVGGNVTIYGYVYVTRTWSNGGGGTANVIGNVVVNGDFSANGTPDITYDPSLSNNLNNLGEFAKVPGSWKDL